MMLPPAPQDLSAVEVLNRAFFLNFPRDAARKIETLPPEEGASVLAPLPTYILQPVWANIAPGVADPLLRHLPSQTVSNLLMGMDTGPCTALLGRFDKETQERFLSLLDPDVAKELRELLEYPSDTAGSMMDTNIIAFNENITVADALSQLKSQKIEALHYLFLLDDSMRLHGQVDIQRLALAEGDEKLSSLSMPVRTFVNDLDPDEEVLAKLEKFGVRELPVVSANGQLLGIIHEERLLTALKQDIVDDIQTMVGVSPDERALSTSFFAVRKRLPWLQINLLTAFFAAAVVGLFEDTIAKYTALAVLMPVAAGQAGNAGAQALAVTMRGLTLREITTRHWLKVMMKEMNAGLLNGVAIALTCGLGVYVWSKSLGLAAVMAIAMIISMTIAGIAGALVPILLKRMGQDPAQSSSIILTTVTDVAGFMSFLGTATLLSNLLEL